MRIRTVLAATVTVGGLLAASSAVNAAAYTFTQIDVPGGTSTAASGINDAGQIVGSFSPNISGNFIYGFLDTGGSFTQVLRPGTDFTQAFGINDAGQIVGIFTKVVGSSLTVHGFLDTGGSFTDIDVPSAIVPNATVTQVSGINVAGQIVGFSDNDVGLEHGFLNIGGSFTQIDVPGATVTLPNAINDADQIVGSFHNSTGEHGFLEIGGSFTQIDVPGATSTEAFGINDAGQIVGEFSTGTGPNPPFHGFLATPATPVTVGTMPVSYGCLLFTVCSGTQYSYSFSDLSGTGDVFIPISDQVGVATVSSVSGLADATLITDPATISADWPGAGNVIPPSKSIFDDPAGLLEVPENGSTTLSFSFDTVDAPVNGPILADGNLLDPLVPGPASVLEPSTISLLAMALVWTGLVAFRDRRRCLAAMVKYSPLADASRRLPSRPRPGPTQRRARRGAVADLGRVEILRI